MGLVRYHTSDIGEVLRRIRIKLMASCFHNKIWIFFRGVHSTNEY